MPVPLFAPSKPRSFPTRSILAVLPWTRMGVAERTPHLVNPLDQTTSTANLNGVINRLACHGGDNSPMPSAGTPFRYSVRGGECESAGVTTAMAARQNAAALGGKG